MQFLLNETEHKEYLAIKARGDDLDKAGDALKQARDYMLEKADYVCVHKREGRYVGYCDDCPCSPLKHNDYHAWKLICGRTTEYSK